MIDKVLLAGDVDSIKDFVFETSSLPQVRGGSQLLLECEETIRSKWNEYVQFCGGGSFLLDVPADQAHQIKKEIERIYLDKTLVATVTVVTEDNGPSWQSEGALDRWAGRVQRAARPLMSNDSRGFAQRMRAIESRLREAKTSRAWAPFFEALPFAQRCESCGRRMAAHIVERREPNRPGEITEFLLCSVCNIKHRTGVGDRAAADAPDVARYDARGKFNILFHQHFLPKSHQARDLDELVGKKGRQYLAFVYADGNDIGSRLAAVEDADKYKLISQALLEETQSVLFGVLHDTCGVALDSGGYWPFEIVNIGGDDITLLIHGGYAWEVAIKFLEGFEQRTAAALGEGLTAACGMIIADPRYPMRYMQVLANDSLKRAKRLAKADPQNPQSTVDFLWLPNPVMSDHIASLVDYYRAAKGQLLTARPYTLDQARKLMELSERVRDWPRSQRYQWAEALAKGVSVSLNAIHYNIARKSKEERSQLIQLLDDVGSVIHDAPKGTPHAVWQPDDSRGYRTALLDVLELAELRGTRDEREA